MVKGLLADINIQGQVRILIGILDNKNWLDLWAPLHLPLLRFRDLGLASTVSDAVLWLTCQQEQVILITANRNAAGPDSLEATIKAWNKAESLPVFTLADSQRIMHSKDYAEQTAAKLLDYLLNIDLVLGTGRLYLP